MNGPETFARLGRLVLVAACFAVPLGACSMAGLPTLKPAPAKAVTKAAATERPTALVAEMAGRAESGEAFVPLAFAEPAPKRSGLDGLIAKYANLYDVPESLIHRVVKRESTYNPRARNGPYYGLMQIRHDTARSMGYSGTAEGLLDAETNLKYSVKYLRGAYITAGYNSDGAVRNYSRGYYYEAKRLGLLEEAGLR